MGKKDPFTLVMTGAVVLFVLYVGRIFWRGRKAE
jgi:hypothetical protein